MTRPYPLLTNSDKASAAAMFLGTIHRLGLIKSGNVNLMMFALSMLGQELEGDY